MIHRFLDTPEGLMSDTHGLFIDTECPCQRSTLYEYVVIHYNKAVDVAGDFIKKYRAYPQEAARIDPVIQFDRKNGINQMEIGARIKAFTIADAFRYIQARKGESIRPNHRVLEFDDSTGIFGEVHSCRFVLRSEVIQKSPEETTDMFAQMRANYLAKFGEHNA